MSVTNPILAALMGDKIAVPRAILGAACYIIRCSEHSESQTAKAMRAFAYADGIELPLGDIPDRARDLAVAFAQGGFMMTEPHLAEGRKIGRKLVIGFAQADDADEAMLALGKFLADYRVASVDGAPS